MYLYLHMCVLIYVYELSIDLHFVFTIKKKYCLLRKPRSVPNKEVLHYYNTHLKRRSVVKVIWFWKHTISGWIVPPPFFSYQIFRILLVWLSWVLAFQHSAAGSWLIRSLHLVHCHPKIFIALYKELFQGMRGEVSAR